MIEAIIFDLDGVIVDTAIFHYQAWKRLALKDSDEAAPPVFLERHWQRID